MGNYISRDEMEEISNSLIGSCEKMKIWINNLWKYIYNQDEKKHMQ